MKSNGLINEIRAILLSHSDVDRAKQMQAYMKGHFIYYGIASVERRAITKEIIDVARQLSTEEKFDIAYMLWQEPHRECQYLAMDILATSEKKLDLSDIDQTECLISNKSWWDTVDWLASHLVGQILRGFPEESDAYIMRWLESDHIWLNRTCLIYQLFYKRDTDFGRLQDYILVLQPKQDFFIQKAIGWSLRQYSRVDPIAVEEFVINHPELSNLARREAMRLINKNQ